MNILDKLQKNTSLTENGKNWLISALDPFHDKDLVLSGYPDLNTASTVVQLVKQSIQISRPSTVSSANNWDCEMVLFPSAKGAATGGNSNYVSVAQGGFVSGVPIVTPCTVGGFTAMGCAQGGQMYPNPFNQQDATAINVGSLDPSVYCKGNFRVIGMGFEVVNTTAQMFKQGQVAAWRQPTQWTDDTVATLMTSATFNYNNYPIKTARLPPALLAEAMLLYGTRCWDAADGAYVVSRQNQLSNPLTQGSRNPLMYSVFDTNVNAPILNTYITNSTLPTTVTLGFLPDRDIPFDMSGVFFTGLSPTTTLTVNVRWLIERMPSAQESDLVVLASPPSCFDGQALEIFEQALCGLPPGVRLSENPLGEWFRSALKNVAAFAPKVGEALSVVPGFGGAGMVGRGLGKAAGYLATRGSSSRSLQAGLPPPPPPPPPPRKSGEVNQLKTQLKDARARIDALKARKK